MRFTRTRADDHDPFPDLTRPLPQNKQLVVDTVRVTASPVRSSVQTVGVLRNGVRATLSLVYERTGYAHYVSANHCPGLQVEMVAALAVSHCNSELLSHEYGYSPQWFQYIVTTDEMDDATVFPYTSPSSTPLQVLPSKPIVIPRERENTSEATKIEWSTQPGRKSSIPDSLKAGQ